MLEIKKNKDGINVEKLYAELLKGLSFRCSSTYNDSSFRLYFPDLRKIEKNTAKEGETENIVVTYEKRTFETVTETVTEQGADGNEATKEVSKEVEKWVDCTDEVKTMLLNIKTVIAEHDPTPLPTAPTDAERLAELENVILMML